MAYREKRPPQQRTIDDTIRELRDVTGRLTNLNDPVQRQAVDRLRREAEGQLQKPPQQRESEQITPEQMERLRRALGELNQKVQDIQSGRPAPRPGQRAAPRRVFNYDVTIGHGPSARTFRIGLVDSLPPGRESQMLMDMANHHEFFESGPSGPSRVTTPNTPAPRAQAEQLAGPGAAEFNKGPQMARIDNLEVALILAGSAGTPVSVAAVSPTQPQTQPQTRQRGG